MNVTTAIKPKGYICGPMRGIPEFNYPLFNTAAAYYRELGYEIRNPAEKDAADGFDGDLSNFSMTEAMQWDLEAVLWADYIILLPNWHKSSGGAIETAVAQAAGKWPRIVLVSEDGTIQDNAASWEWINENFPDRVPVNINKMLGITQVDHEKMMAENGTMAGVNVSQSPLERAYEIVHGDRGGVYGHPFDDFARQGKIWEAILGIPVTPEQVALCMIGVKISRLVNTPGHPDSQVDVAGYLETYNMIRQRRADIEANAELEEFLHAADELGISEGVFYVNEEDEGNQDPE